VIAALTTAKDDISLGPYCVSVTHGETNVSGLETRAGYKRRPMAMIPRGQLAIDLSRVVGNLIIKPS